MTEEDVMTAELIPGTVEYHEYAVAVDTEIVRLYGEVFSANHQLNYREASVRHTLENRNYLVREEVGHRFSRQYEYFFANDHFEFSIEETQRRFAAGEYAEANEWFIRGLDKALVDYAATLKVFQDAMSALRAEQRKYTGWSRFFLVMGGHAHKSMDCSTCNNGKEDTRFYWYPELAGLTEKDAVDAVGAVLCTVCFPSAPVEYTNQYDLEKLAKLARRCEGSGQRAKWTSGDDGRSGHWDNRCPVCGEWATITPNDKYRAHDKPEVTA